MIISLTGFMGCGKSSVGKALSELLCCRFADLDEVIVEREGRSIPEIFAEDGEEKFRRMEKEALEGVLRGCEERIPGQSLNILVKSGTRQCAPLAPSQLSLGPSPYPRVGKCQLRTTALYPHDNKNSRQTPEHIENHIIQFAKEVRMVLALGGGAVMREECEERVHSGTFCIYLRASVETLVKRLTGEAGGRPLIAGADSGRSSNPSVMSGGPTVMSSEVETSALRTRILELMSQRSETYERVAHLIVETDGKSVGEIAEEIIRSHV